jgi:hypothetical protein
MPCKAQSPSNLEKERTGRETGSDLWLPAHQHPLTKTISTRKKMS